MEFLNELYDAFIMGCYVAALVAGFFYALFMALCFLLLLMTGTGILVKYFIA